MGTNKLSKLPNIPRVQSSTEQYNDLVEALSEDLMMRDADGNVIDGGFDIGQPAAGRADILYLKEGININGVFYDLSSNGAAINGILDCKKNTDGYETFLEAGGTGVATATIKASVSEPLVFNIDGVQYKLESDLTTGTLFLDGGVANTANLNSYVISTANTWDSSTQNFVNLTIDLDGDQLTKTRGEFGLSVSHDAAWTETNYDDHAGRPNFYMIENSSAEKEIFSVGGFGPQLGAMVEGVQGIRGRCGTSRVVLDSGSTIKFVRPNFLFLEKTMGAIQISKHPPRWSFNETEAHANTATGDYWFDLSVDKWKKYNGSIWEVVEVVYIGIAVCDNTGCLWVEPAERYINYSGFLSGKGMQVQVDYSSNDIINIDDKLKLEVGDQTIELNSGYVNESITISDDLRYIYASNLGQIEISDECPRDKNHKKGYYHPFKLWRCIGFLPGKSNLGTLAEKPSQPLYFNYATGSVKIPFHVNIVTGTHGIINLKRNFVADGALHRTNQTTHTVKQFRGIFPQTFAIPAFATDGEVMLYKSRHQFAANSGYYIGLGLPPGANGDNNYTLEKIGDEVIFHNSDVGIIEIIASTDRLRNGTLMSKWSDSATGLMVDWWFYNNYLSSDSDLVTTRFWFLLLKKLNINF